MRFRRGLRELSFRLELWRGSFKTIEGHFGSGVVSYFTFLKWLFMLNLAIFLLLFLFLVLPQILFPPLGYDDWITGMGNTSDAGQNRSFICSALYDLSVNVSHNDPLQLVLDFLQGTVRNVKIIIMSNLYHSLNLKYHKLMSPYAVVPLPGFLKIGSSAEIREVGIEIIIQK